MINFDNAKVLEYSHAHEFLGSLFRFGVRKNITIEGEIYNLGNDDGVSGIWAGISGMVDQAIDYDDVYLNGVDFGRGRVESLSFTEGVDVTRKNYRANLVVFESGSLSSMTGVDYSGLRNLPVPYHLLESFSESFSLNLPDSKQGSIEQSIDIKFVSGAAAGLTGNPIGYARILASGLRYSPCALPFALSLYPWLNVSNKQFATESYNAISNDCRFSFSSDLRSGASAYSFSYTNSLNTDNNGFCRVSERGEVIGTSGNLYNSALLGYNLESSSSYPRCNSLYVDYGIGNTGGLRSTPVRSSRTNDHFAGKISYEVDYTDDLSINNGYSWSYSHDIRKADGCFYEISENGEVAGLLTNCTGDRATLSESGWAAVQTGISGRVYEYYNAATQLTKAVKLMSKGVSNNSLDGIISYNTTFSDNQNNNISGFKSIDYSVENKLPVHLANKLPIANVGEVVQPAYITTPSAQSASLRVIGVKSKTLSDYTALAKGVLNSLSPTGDDTHISNLNYSLSPIDNSFQISCEWVWFSSRAFSNVTV